MQNKFFSVIRAGERAPKSSFKVFVSLPPPAGEFERHTLRLRAALCALALLLQSGAPAPATSRNPDEAEGLIPGQQPQQSAHEGVRGRSLAPLLRNPRARWDDTAHTVTMFRNRLGRAVRSARRGYAEWYEGRAGAMLFDETRDRTNSGTWPQTPPTRRPWAR
jgi:hypothetical protein